MYAERKPIIVARSPDERVHVEILPPTNTSPSYYASVVVEGSFSMSFPFGYNAAPEEVTLKWDLPDDTLAILIHEEYYVLFRFGARRRRRREYFRVGRENAFSGVDVSWITAKDHSRAHKCG